LARTARVRYEPRVATGRDSRARRLARASLHLAPLGFVVLVQITWLASLASAPDPMAAARRDWHAFFETGRHLVAGELHAIYPRTLESGYFWLYPPYCIYLTAPLGMLPEPAAYIVCVAVEIAAVVAALALLRAVLQVPRAAIWLAAGAVFASMPLNTTLAMGQISGVLALVLAGALWLWHARRAFPAGLALALLFIKPNLAAFFVAACLLARQWRMLAGIASGVALLVLLSLPLGLARWGEYVSTTQHYVDVVRDATPLWKQLTLYAFWRTVPGLGHETAHAAWIVSIAGAAAAVAFAWQRARADAERVPRLFALTVLLAVVANVYLYFYDGLLLMIPGIVWYARRREYRSSLCHVGAGACIGLVFVVGYAQVFFSSSGASWAGAVIAVWLTCEAADLLLPEPAPAHVESDVRRPASGSA
jgi:hypothetical protein